VRDDAGRDPVAAAEASDAAAAVDWHMMAAEVGIAASATAVACAIPLNVLRFVP